ncbi:MAG: hypothetical protein K2X38_15170 [Gemmataceae bacterium]|nr:hypothetical protein [Gemmataceae bacterium]
MKLVPELVEYFRETRELTLNDVRLLKAAGFLHSDGSEWEDGRNSWEDDGCDDPDYDPQQDMYEEQEAIRRALQLGSKVGGGVGRSRMRWRKKFEMSREASRAGWHV